MNLIHVNFTNENEEELEFIPGPKYEWVLSDVSNINMGFSLRFHPK